MGHQFSKADGDTDVSRQYPPPHFRRGPPQKASSSLDNDGLSRTTEITDESMTPPPSPCVGKLRHSERWRRGVISSSTTTSSRESYPMVDASHSMNGRYPPQHQNSLFQLGSDLLPRRDSDPGHPSGLMQSAQPRTVPVKCPPRKRATATSVGGEIDAAECPTSHEDSLEASHLERMYDSRTWEMYRRITEARRQSQTRYVPKLGGTKGAVPPMDRQLGPRGGSHAVTRSLDDTSEWEHLQQEEEDPASEEQHEMVFLFDF